MTKNSRQKVQYLENKKSFECQKKIIFHHFKELSVVINSTRLQSVPLKNTFPNTSLDFILDMEVTNPRHYD